MQEVTPLLEQQHALSADTQFLSELNSIGARVPPRKKRSIFISHAWRLPLEEDQFNEQWVDKFVKIMAEHIRLMGFEVTLDFDNLGIGVHKQSEMKKLQDHDHVLLVVSRTYLHKVSMMDSGVANEFSFIKEKVRVLGEAEAGKQRFLLPFAMIDDLTGFPAVEGHGGFAAVFLNRVGYRAALLELPDKLYGLRASGEKFFTLLNKHKFFAAENKMSSPIKQNIPAKNTHFSGRRDKLKEIKENFLNNQMQVVTGLGGVGKTQLVTEYAYGGLQESRYDAVVLLYANRNLDAEYNLLAREGLPQELRFTPQSDCVGKVLADAVYQKLAGLKVLFILDNAKDYNKVEHYFPVNHPNIHLLMTSRRKEWGICKAVRLKPFSDEEACEYIENYLGGAKQPSAIKLSRVLGGLALALAQALAYIKKNEITIDQYLVFFQQNQEKQKRLLQEFLLDGEVYNEEQVYLRTVYTTWDMSMFKIKVKAPRASEVLKFCAYLSAEAIPYDLIAAWLGIEKFDLLEIFKHLHKYSLVDCGPNEVYLHRLVQTVVRWRTDERADVYIEKVLAFMAGKFLPMQKMWDTPEKWNYWGQLIPHALALVCHAQERGLQWCFGELPENLQSGIYWLVKTKEGMRWKLYYIEESLRRRDVPLESIDGLTAVLIALGDKNPENLSSAEKSKIRKLMVPFLHHASSIAKLLRLVGGYEWVKAFNAEAKQHLENALMIATHVEGAKHPDVLAIQRELSRVLIAGGYLSEASNLIQKNSKDVLEMSLGNEACLEMASVRHELGRVLSRKGDHKAARDEFQRSLEILNENSDRQEALFEKASVLHQLGTVLFHLDENDEAETCLLECLRLKKTLYAAVESEVYPEHPKISATLRGLGILCLAKNDLGRADLYLVNSLSIEATLHGGDDHPRVLICLFHLGRLRYMQSNYPEAIKLFERRLNGARTFAKGKPSRFVFSSLQALCCVTGNQEYKSQALDEGQRLNYDRDYSERILSLDTIPSRLPIEKKSNVSKLIVKF